MDIEDLVARWAEAKERRDYATADALRAELRAAGHDPDAPRRKDPNRELEMKLAKWQQAKASKDFATADALRDELRVMGVDPDPRGSGGGRGGAAVVPQSFVPQSFAPPSYAAPPPAREPRRSSFRSSAGPYDAQIEGLMDDWEDAKSRKDYATADDIRSQLRDRGRSPAKERPQHPSVEDEIEQWKRAKAAKDFRRSDRIRSSLRSRGINPDDYGGSAPPMRASAPQGGFGPSRGRADSGYMQGMMDAYASMGMPLGGGGGGGGRSSHNGGGGGGGRSSHNGGGGSFSPRSEAPRRQSSSGANPQLDIQTLDDLRDWFDAKDQRNFAVADEIRDRLRAKGVEPADCKRPSAGGSDIEEELKRWHDAKDARDYATADSLRASLRARGVEPSNMARPGAPGEDEIEQELQEWHDAKARKDFVTADSIRQSLRSRGVSPSKCAPPGGNGGFGAARSARGARSSPYGDSGRGGGGFDRETEREIEDWRRAKQDRDYSTADRIRASLRDRGIEPDQPRGRR